MLTTGSSGPEVSALQDQLRAAGFDPGPSDGQFGPQTQAAVIAFQQAHGLTADGIVGPETQGALGGGSTGPAPTTTGGIPDAIARAIQSQYPNIWAIINKPGVYAVMSQAITENWPATRLQAALEATPYYQQTPATIRQWDLLNAIDPSTAKQQLDFRSAQISDLAGQLGLTLSPDELAMFTNTSLANGMTSTDQWIDLLMTSPSATSPQPGALTSTQDQLKATAAQYAVPLSDQAIAQWAGQIIGGSTTQAAFTSYLITQAKSMFPSLASALDSGITVAQYAEPYKQIAVQQLGINPSAFNLLDPKWSRAVYQIDPQTNQGTPMNLAQWTTTIRSDPQYGYAQTINGQQSAIALGEGLKQMMGAGT